jgi:hypothetical protein
VWTAIQSLDCRGLAPRAPRRMEPRSLVRARSAADWQPWTIAGRSGHQTFTETAGRSAYSPLTLDEGEGRSGVRVSPPAAASPAGSCPRAVITEDGPHQLGKLVAVITANVLWTLLDRAWERAPLAQVSSGGEFAARGGP